MKAEKITAQGKLVWHFPISNLDGGGFLHLILNIQSKCGFLQCFCCDHRRRMLLSSRVQRGRISLEVSNVQVYEAFFEHIVLIAVKTLGHSLLSMDLLIGQDVHLLHVNVRRLEITELSDNLLGDLLSL